MTTIFSSLYFLRNFLTKFFLAADRKTGDPEYAIWIKNKDKSINNPALFVGQKTAMKNMFGNKISLLPKNLTDVSRPTKYESRIIIQESDDETTDTARKIIASNYFPWHQSNTSIRVNVLISRICVCIGIWILFVNTMMQSMLSSN
jgi:hypothetical protein